MSPLPKPGGQSVSGEGAAIGGLVDQGLPVGVDRGRRHRGTVRPSRPSPPACGSGRCTCIRSAPARSARAPGTSSAATVGGSRSAPGARASAVSSAPAPAPSTSSPARSAKDDKPLPDTSRRTVMGIPDGAHTPRQRRARDGRARARRRRARGQTRRAHRGRRRTRLGARGCGSGYRRGTAGGQARPAPCPRFLGR